MTVIAAGLFALGPLSLSATAAEETGDTSRASEAGRYQIVEATAERVWRLDTQTGEIAVCTLSGDRLVCTASSEAARPAPKDYETLTAEQEAAETSERKEQLAFLDKMLEMFRELVRYALQQDQGGGQP
jgi:hypothetical protein